MLVTYTLPCCASSFFHFHLCLIGQKATCAVSRLEMEACWLASHFPERELSLLLAFNEVFYMLPVLNLPASFHKTCRQLVL